MTSQPMTPTIAPAPAEQRLFSQASNLIAPTDAPIASVLSGVQK